jgi:hypothetical protein
MGQHDVIGGINLGATLVDIIMEILKVKESRGI